MSGSTDGLKVISCKSTLQAVSDGLASCLNPSPAISTSEISETGLEESEENNTHNVTTINEQEELVLQEFPSQGSPYARRQNERKRGVQERPFSVALPMKDESNTENTIEEKSKSDNDILKGDDLTPVWVHRQVPRLQKRHSDGALRHHLIRRKSSSISCASGMTGTSMGSLDTSKDSLIDSGVSGTSDNSPTNTLNKTVSGNLNNFKQLSEEEKLVFDDVIASGFKKGEKKAKSEDQLEEKTKSKKKLKKVFKNMFSKSLR